MCDLKKEVISGVFPDTRHQPQDPPSTVKKLERTDFFYSEIPEFGVNTGVLSHHGLEPESDGHMSLFSSDFHFPYRNGLVAFQKLETGFPDTPNKAYQKSVLLEGPTSICKVN